jgi:hypothetical protein
MHPVADMQRTIKGGPGMPGGDDGISVAAIVFIIALMVTVAGLGFKIELISSETDPGPFLANGFYGVFSGGAIVECFEQSCKISIYETKTVQIDGQVWTENSAVFFYETGRGYWVHAEEE